MTQLFDIHHFVFNPSYALKQPQRIALIFLGVLIPFLALAQPERVIGQWSPLGEIKALSPHPDGQHLFVVGNFERWTNPRPYASVLDRESLLPLPGGEFLDGEVMDVIADGTGGWYVGGKFDLENNSARNGLYHLDSELNVIPGFPAIAGAVHTLKQVGDTLFAAGSFTSAGGLVRRGLAAISLSTSQVLELDVKINGEVRSIDLWNDTLFLGGDFNGMGHFGNYGAQLNKFTGDVDAYTDAPNGIVTASVGDGNGGWFIGGQFLQVGDSSRWHLAHIGADGRVTGWKCNMGFEPGSFVIINALEIHGDYLYVVGKFEKMGSELRSNGGRVHIETAAVDAWHPNFYGRPECMAFHEETVFLGGSYDFRLTGNWVSNGGVVDPETALLMPSGPKIDDVVLSSIPDGEGGFFIAGVFSQVGDSTRHGLAQVNATGQATTFKLQLDEPTIQLLSIAHHEGIIYCANNISGDNFLAVDMQGHQVPIDMSGLPSMNVRSLKVAGDTLYMAGYILQAPGGGSMYTIRALSLPDHQHLPFAPRFGGEVTDMEALGNSLYVAGNFASINQARYGAIIDAASLESTNLDLLTNGSVYVASGDGEGGFYIAGQYSEITNGELCDGVVYITAEGLSECIGIDTDGEVLALRVKGDTLLIGGHFTEVNGSARSNFAAWSISNEALLAWSPNFSARVRTMATAGNTLFVGGNFDEVNGQTRNRLAAFDLQGGATLMAFAPAVSSDVLALHVHDDELFVGGFFTSINSVNRGRIASFNLQTLTMTPWNPSANNSVTDITTASGQLFVAGTFSSIGGATRHKFAAIPLGSNSPNSLSFGYSQNWHEVNALETDGVHLLIGGRFGTFNNGHYRVVNTETNQTLSLPLANDRVRCIARSGDQFFVGGDFTQIAGTPSSGLVELDRNTGALLDFNPDFTGTVNYLTSDGTYLYAGGIPGLVEGTSTGRLAIFDLGSGEVVNTTPYFNNVFYNNTKVTALQSLGDRIYIGLSNTNNSPSFSHSRNFALSLDANDHTLTDFDPKAFGDVSTISVSGNGLYIGGKLVHMGGTTLDGFAAFDIPGGDFLPDMLVMSSGTIFALEVYDDLLIAGGSNISAGGGMQRSLTAYHLENEQEVSLSSLPGPSGVVIDMDIHGDMLYFGGNSLGINHQHVSSLNLSTGTYAGLNLPIGPNNGHIFQVKADESGLFVSHAGSGLAAGTRYVSAFDPSTSTRINGWGIDVTSGSFDKISTLSLQGDHLYIGGNTAMIGNNRPKHLASVSLATGTETTWKPKPNNPVNVVLALDSGIYVGGSFTLIDTVPSAKYMARLNPSTAEVTATLYHAWVKAEVLDLAFQASNQHIYVSGEFTTADGSAANHLLAISQEENFIVPNWQAGPLDTPVLLTLHDDELWIQDHYVLTIGGDYMVRRLLPDGSFSNDSIPFYGRSVRAMAFQGDEVFLGGYFAGAGGIPRHNLAEIDAATGQLTDFNPDLPFDVILKVVMEGDNLIILGRVGGSHQIRAIDVNTYELLPDFEELPFLTDFTDRDLELYNGAYFYKLQNMPLRRRDALSGAQLEIPDVSHFASKLTASSGYLYLWGKEFVGSNITDVFERIDIEAEQFAEFDFNPNGAVTYMNQLDGKVYIAGSFTEVNGIPQVGVARIDGATGAMDDWWVEGIDVEDIFGFFASGNALYHSVFSVDSWTPEFRQVDTESGMMSAWSLPLNANNVADVAGRLYVAGDNFPLEFAPSQTLTAYIPQVCTTEVSCNDVTLYLNEDGEASLTASQVELETISDCAIQNLGLSQSNFSCEHLGENEVTLTVVTINMASTTCTAQVLVLDTINPVWMVQDVGYQIPAGGSLSIDPADFVAEMSDNCGIDSVSATGQTVFTCADQGQTFEVEVTVTDLSGNGSALTATVTVLPSEVCCEATASFAENEASICASQSFGLPIVLSGVPPFQISLLSNGDTTHYVISDPAADSIYVSPAFTTVYELTSMSDANCTAFAEGIFDLVVEQPRTAGPDQDISLCADGQEVAFIDYAHPDAGDNLAFAGTAGGLATADLAGTYTLVDYGQACANDTAIYQFSFGNPFSIANLSVYCAQPNPYVYVVSFEVIGGTPPFAASNGSFAGSAFTSMPLSVLNEPVTLIAVSDAGGCAIEVEAEVADTDGDGVCDAGEIAGCMDPIAANYNPMATDPEPCSYFSGEPPVLTDEITSGTGIGGGGGGGPDEEPGRPADIILFPNPVFKDKPVNVLFKSFAASTELRIELMDITGRLIQAQTLSVDRGDSQSSILFKESLTQGVYLVNFFYLDQLTARRLFIME